jgi:hypothetical protein
MDDQAKQSLVRPVQNTTPTTLKSEEQTLSEQTVTPTPRTLGGFVVQGKDKSSFSTQVHWTVRLRVTTMSQRTAAILLKVLVLQFIFNGIDLTGYLAVEYLVNFIQKGKKDPLEIYEEKDRQAAMLGTLILAAIRGTWMTLDERIKVSPQTAQEVLDTGWLPDKRTYNSWKQFHNPRSFLEVLTVPLDLYDERDTSTTRYSGYTKGYGNGGHISRTKKTPYDSELDGEATDREPPDFNLLEIEQYNHILFSIEREKLQRRDERK